MSIILNSLDIAYMYYNENYEGAVLHSLFIATAYYGLAAIKKMELSGPICLD